MTAPQAFALCWSVLALILGFAFARFPRFMVSQYEQQWRKTPLIGRREFSSELRARMVVLYRVGGVVFMVIGVCVGTAAALGLIR